MAVDTTENRLPLETHRLLLRDLVESDWEPSLNQQYALTVVLVSHDASIAQQTDRIIHMKNGQIEREVKPAIIAS